eukprot:5764818-Amphidinium_carterae.1
MLCTLETTGFNGVLSFCKPSTSCHRQRSAKTPERSERAHAECSMASHTLTQLKSVLDGGFALIPLHSRSMAATRRLEQSLFFAFSGRNTCDHEGYRVLVACQEVMQAVMPSPPKDRSSAVMHCQG